MDDSDPDAIRTTTFESGRGRRRFTLAQTSLWVAVVALGLALIGGDSARDAAEQLDEGPVRDVALTLAKPLGALADALPVGDAVDNATAFLAPDEDLGGEFTLAAQESGPPAVTVDAFDPKQFGERAAKRPLKRLLVTGDSLSMPLDAELARRLVDAGVTTVRDPHVGSGISKSTIVDWGKLSREQVSGDAAPDAVVMFIGANEGFPFKDVECCGRDWAAAYASRVRQLMATYRREDAARVYWLTLPAPRDGERAKIATTVNAAIRVAAEPYRAQVRVLDMGAIFTPDGFRAAMPVDGDEQIVRESDGIHLNQLGARVAADKVLEAIREDFAL